MTRGISADFGLAWRNVWRHKTRTAVTGMAIALSLALQFFSYGTADYSYEKMEDHFNLPLKTKWRFCNR